MPDPSSSLVVLREYYKGAVALNNIGIVLLEQRAYRQALDTLKDAVFCMKVIFRPTNTTTNIQAKLQRASERIASPQIEDCSSTVMTETLSNVGSSLESITTVMQKQGTAFVFPIRIEEMDDNDYDLDIDSATILHNFAIAHLCCSRIAAKTTLASAELFRQSASRLASFAYNLLSNVLNQKQQQQQQGDDYESLVVLRETRILVSALVALHTLVQAFMEMGNYVEAEKTYKRLLELGLAVAQEPELQSLGAAAA